MTRKQQNEVVAFEFTTAAGRVFRRGFILADVPEQPEIPDWLGDLSKKWDKPGDPVVYTGTITKGHEAEARRWLRSLTPKRRSNV